MVTSSHKCSHIFHACNMTKVFHPFSLVVINLIKPKLQLHLQLHLKFTYDQTYKHMHIHMMKCVQCTIEHMCICYPYLVTCDLIGYKFRQIVILNR